MPEPLLAIEMQTYSAITEALEDSSSPGAVADICRRAMSSSLCAGHAQAETVAAALMRSAVRASLSVARRPVEKIIAEAAQGLLKACTTFASDFQRSLDLNQIALAVTRAAAGPLQASGRRLPAWTLASQAVAEAVRELPQPRKLESTPLAEQTSRRSNDSGSPVHAWN